MVASRVGVGRTYAMLHVCRLWRGAVWINWASSHVHSLIAGTILTLNSLSRIKLRLGQVEELVCSRMKYSRLYVILLHLVLSAKSVYNF